MVNINGSNPLDVGSIPATPAKKIKKKCKNIWLFEKKSSIFASEIENKRTLN